MYQDRVCSLGDGLPSVQGGDETVHLQALLVPQGVPASALVQVEVCQVAITIRDLAGCLVLETAPLLIPKHQLEELVLSYPPWQAPTAQSCSEQAPAHQSPTVEGVEARIDIP